MDATKTYDRSKEDISNIIWMEHINTTVPDQIIATLFYITGLGLTRDPYIMTGLENIWVNIGKSQIHMPTREPQILRGHTAIVQPNRQALLKRLLQVSKKLEHTKFKYSEKDDHVEVTCPWGNVIKVFEPNRERFGNINIGIPYVEFNVPLGTAYGITKFYKQVLKANSNTHNNNTGSFAQVLVGHNQNLIFRETSEPLPEYDGHHIQIYVSNFSAPHSWLLNRGLITQESDQYQYRFKDIIDPDSSQYLYTIEHEVRSITHPLFNRPLVNRNPEQTNRNYTPGYDPQNLYMPFPN